jgi:hypothetical protein
MCCFHGHQPHLAKSGSGCEDKLLVHVAGA